MAAGRPGPRRRRPAGRRGGGLLPVAAPQLRACPAGCWATCSRRPARPGGGDTARGLRSVAWERTAGQVVQVAVAVVVLLLLPSPLRPSWPRRRRRARRGGARLRGGSPRGGPRRGRRRGRGGARRCATTSRGLLARRLAGRCDRLRAWPWRATSRRSSSRPGRSASPRRSRRWCRSCCWCWSRPGCRLNVAGWGPARAWRRGRSVPPGWAPTQGVATAVAYGVLVLVGLPARARCCCSWAGAAPHAVVRPARRSSRGGPMAERPYTMLSCGMSLDGYLDAASPQRLVLSNDADLERVDAVRADVRRDPGGRRHRAARRPAAARPVPVAARGAGGPRAAGVAGEGHADPDRRLDPRGCFFTTGEQRQARLLRERRRDRAPGAGSAPSRPSWTPATRSTVRDVVEDLARPGRTPADGRGRGAVHTQFLTAGPRRRAAPGGGAVLRRGLPGPPVRGSGAYPWHPGHRARLAETRQIGDVVLLRYALSRRREVPS